MPINDNDMSGLTLEQALDSLIEREAQRKLLQPSTWFKKQQTPGQQYGDPAWHQTKQTVPDPSTLPNQSGPTQPAPAGPTQPSGQSEGPNTEDPIPNVFTTDQTGEFVDQPPNDFAKAMENYVGALGKKAPTTYKGNPDSGMPTELSMPNTKNLYNAIVSKFYQNQRDHMAYFEKRYREAKYKHQRDQIRMQALEWMAQQRGAIDKLNTIYNFWTKTKPKLDPNPLRGTNPPGSPAPQTPPTASPADPAISLNDAVSQSNPNDIDGTVSLKPIDVPTPEQHEQWERERRNLSDRKHREKVKDLKEQGITPAKVEPQPNPAAPPPEFRPKPTPSPAPPAPLAPTTTVQPAKQPAPKRQTKQQKLDEINNELTALQTQWGPYQSGQKTPGTYEEKQELMRGIERIRELQQSRDNLNAPRKRAPKTTAPAPQPEVTPETAPVTNIVEKKPKRTRRNTTKSQPAAPQSQPAATSEMLEIYKNRGWKDRFKRPIYINDKGQAKVVTNGMTVVMDENGLPRAAPQTPKSGVRAAEEFLARRAESMIPWYRRG